MSKEAKSLGEFLSDPRIFGFAAHRSDNPIHHIGEMQVQELFPFVQPAQLEDGYHQYTLAGQNASNTNRHHDYGDVAIMFAETAPFDEQGRPNTERYVIICDNWTGKRIKVILPQVKQEG